MASPLSRSQETYGFSVSSALFLCGWERRPPSSFFAGLETRSLLPFLRHFPSPVLSHTLTPSLAACTLAELPPCASVWGTRGLDPKSRPAAAGRGRSGAGGGSDEGKGGGLCRDARTGQPRTDSWVGV